MADAPEAEREVDELDGMDQIEVAQFAARVISEDYADANTLREFLRENGLTPEEIDG